MAGRRLAPNLFGVPFGVTGLGVTWSTAARSGLVTPLAGDALLALAAALWVVVAVDYGRGLRGRAGLLADLTDPVLAPFLSLGPIVGMVLAAAGLYPHAHQAGRVAFDAFAVATVALGGWFTGQWIYGPLAPAALHPGYFLPTVAGGLLAAEGAGAVGQAGLGRVCFGLGTLCWLILGSMILGRLFVGPPLAAPLTPTLAIEVAPAAVATNAWFALHGAHPDAVAAALAGYGLLMVLAQVRLLPLYARARFAPGSWAFAFSWCAVASAALQWVAIEAPAGATAESWTVLGAATALVGALAGRTLAGLWLGTFLPPAAIASPPAPGTDPPAVAAGRPRPAAAGGDLAGSAQT